MEIPNQMPDGYLESFVQSHSVERTDGHCLKSQSHWDRSILGKLRIVAGFRKLQYEMVSRRISGERTPSHSLWHHGPLQVPLQARNPVEKRSIIPNSGEDRTCMGES